MTKEEAFRYFKQTAPMSSFRLKSGRIDRIALNEAWGVFIDALCKQGRITPEQFATWGNPRVRHVKLAPDEVAEVVETPVPTKDEKAWQDHEAFMSRKRNRKIA